MPLNPSLTLSPPVKRQFSPAKHSLSAPFSDRQFCPEPTAGCVTINLPHWAPSGHTLVHTPLQSCDCTEHFMVVPATTGHLVPSPLASCVTMYVPQSSPSTPLSVH